jgi:hypothetical protein
MYFLEQASMILTIIEEPFLLTPNCNYNLNLKQITALTSSNMPAGLYFVLKYFSFIFTTRIA